MGRGGVSGWPVAVVGLGRAGGAFAAAFARVDWPVVATYRRGDDVSGAACGDAELVLLCVPDESVAAVAASIEPGAAVVAHVAGSLGLDVLDARHRRRAAIHPLMALPNAALGAERLLSAGWFALAGDRIVEDVVAAFGGRSLTVADADRATYHAAAVVASNHVTALLGQVARLAESIDAPLEPFLDLTAGALASVRELGPAAALTGPAARGDWATIERHRAALAPSERATYDVLVAEAIRLSGRDASNGSGEAAFTSDRRDEDPPSR